LASEQWPGSQPQRTADLESLSCSIRGSRHDGDSHPAD
jgi:hypothetical protein